MPAKKTAKKGLKKKAAKKAAPKTGKKPATGTKKTARLVKDSKTGALKSSVKSKTEKTEKIKKKNLIDCEHCQGVGKCSEGRPFDMDRSQGLFKKEKLVSCVECLVSAGKSRKSKKIVACSYCNGTGKVEKPG